MKPNEIFKAAYEIVLSFRRGKKTDSSNVSIIESYNKNPFSLFDKDLYGLSQSESICAIACNIETYIKLANKYLNNESH